MTFQCTALASGMSLRAQASYMDQQGSKTVYFQVPVLPSDFLRMRSLTVEEFGEQWQRLPAERKQRVAPSCIASMDALSQSIQRDLRIQPVQTIGRELISAGQMLQDASMVVLVHVAVTSQGLEVAIKVLNISCVPIYFPRFCFP